MTLFLQTCGGALVAVILIIFLGKNSGGMAAILSLAACCLVAAIAVHYLTPVIEFLDKLQMMADLDSSMLGILLKAVGIGLIGEIAGLICSDSGNSTLGKTLQILTSAVILYLSIPLFSTVLDLIVQILEEL